MSDPNAITDTDEIFGENKSQPEEKPQETKEVSLKDPVPAKPKTPMEVYYDTVRELDGKYSNAITTYAKQEEFTIPIERKDAKGNLLGEYENKKFKRKKISAGKWEEVEELREDIFAEKDRKKTRALISKLYWICAREYFKMSEDEYKRASWEDVKLAVDASNFRTVKSLPYSQ